MARLAKAHVGARMAVATLASAHAILLACKSHRSDALRHLITNLDILKLIGITQKNESISSLKPLILKMMDVTLTSLKSASRQKLSQNAVMETELSCQLMGALNFPPLKTRA